MDRQRNDPFDDIEFEREREKWELEHPGLDYEDEIEAAHENSSTKW